MADAPHEPAESYHVHVYFDADSRDRAQRLRERVLERFDVEMGRWHEKEVGPHPRWSYQIAFGADLFAALVPWLMLNRDDLVLLLHPNTEDGLADHSDFAVWMGGMPELKLDMFRERKDN